MDARGDEVTFSLDAAGLRNTGKVHWNLGTAMLYEHAIRRGEGLVAHRGPLVVRTGIHTGRAAKDKYVVQDDLTRDRVWWSSLNRPFEREAFERLRLRVLAYLQGRELFVQDGVAGADARHRMRLRVITETAWHNLFARTLFLHVPDDERLGFVPDLTILHAPGFQAVPELDGTSSPTFVMLDLSRRIVLIGGTYYAGEIKKSVFSAMNFMLPQRDVLPMHAAANVGRDGDVAVFFGLSGTGKTTLSTDPERRLIGDDEHGWNEQGVFNFEGGCYAKVIRLSEESEPEIYETTRRFGTILENVICDSDTRQLNLDDDSLTENTRAAYPISYVPSALEEGKAGHPRNVVMLCCDAFGIMPPVARLSSAQAMYHFMSGYTARVAGTERGMGSEPQATFSACYGAPFMTLHPYEYARLLARRLERHDAACWLINTGWAGGGYGVGSRMPIKLTRSLLRAVLDGKLARVPMRTDPVFGFSVPTECPGVPSQLLSQREQWADPASYDQAARQLARRFRQNFEQFEASVPDSVRKGGPL